MPEHNNINFIIEKILEKVEPEKRSIALPLILNILRKKQQNNKNKEKNNYEESELMAYSQDKQVMDQTLLIDQRIINEKEQEEQELEICNNNICNGNQEVTEEDIKYSLNYQDNIVENKDGKNPCQVAEINAIVEESGNLEEESTIITEDMKKKSPIIKPTVLSCKVNVCNVSSLQNCTSESTEDSIQVEVAKEPAIVNVPVVLASANIEIFIDAITKFPEQIFSIEDLDKTMTLTCCELIPYSNKLFLKGFVEKKIEYSNAIAIMEKEISGDIKNLTVKIPFKCTTEVIFARKPEKIKYSPKQKIEIFHTQYNSSKVNKAEEKSSIEIQELENKVYCKLEDVSISEKSKKLGVIHLENTLPNAFTFKKIKEKTVVSFTLSLLQNQDIFIYNKDHIVEKDCEYGTKDLETNANADE